MCRLLLVLWGSYPLAVDASSWCLSFLGGHIFVIRNVWPQLVENLEVVLDKQMQMQQCVHIIICKRCQAGQAEIREGQPSGEQNTTAQQKKPHSDICWSNLVIHF